jgi:Tol biopolymer transport system component
VSFDAGCSQPLWLLFDVNDGFDTTTGGIYAVRADGTALHRVSLPHGPSFFPSVSPDGSKLLYASALHEVDGGPDSALYLYDLASREDRLVVTTFGLTYSALSPDGTTVSYVSEYSLHDVGVDGTNDRTLLAGPNDSGTGYGHPVFAPDSRTIVYGTGGIIGAIGVDGSNDRTLLSAIPGSFQYPNPAFSPDYQRIVVGASCDAQSVDALRLYPFAALPGATCESGQVLVDVEDGSSSNLANDPSWGPGDLIAYGSGKDVYVIGASGGAPIDMTSGLTGDGGTVTAADPRWAPGCADIP